MSPGYVYFLSITSYIKSWPDIDEKYIYLSYILADQLTKRQNQ